MAKHEYGKTKANSENKTLGLKSWAHLKLNVTDAEPALQIAAFTELIKGNSTTARFQTFFCKIG